MGQNFSKAFLVSDCKIPLLKANPAPSSTPVSSCPAARPRSGGRELTRCSPAPWAGADFLSLTHAQRSCAACTPLAPSLTQVPSGRTHRNVGPERNQNDRPQAALGVGARASSSPRGQGECGPPSGSPGGGWRAGPPGTADLGVHEGPRACPEPSAPAPPAQGRRNTDTVAPTQPGPPVPRLLRSPDTQTQVLSAHMKLQRSFPKTRRFTSRVSRGEVGPASPAGPRQVPGPLGRTGLRPRCHARVPPLGGAGAHGITTLPRCMGGLWIPDRGRKRHLLVNSR